MINRIILFVVLVFTSPSFAKSEPLAADSPAEQQIVAEVIAAEACGEGVQGMALVAEVIRNRARAWNKTPFEVVTQKGQFCGLRHPQRQKLFLQCKETAGAIKGQLYADSLKNDAKGALYFQTLETRRQKWHKVKLLVYKRHVFYK